MTVFAKRRMNVTEWGPVQHRIGSLQLMLRGPHDLMMFSAETDDPLQQDIFIGLPDPSLLSTFPGFELIHRGCIPDRVTMLVAREDRFAELFPDISAKRNAASLRSR